VRRFTTRALAALSLVLAAATSFALPPRGLPVPAAPFETLDGHPLQLRGFVDGRPLLIFYEDRGSREQNRPLKNQLLQLGRDESLRRGVVIVPVADLRRFNYWPAKGLARSQLRQEEKRIGRQIYADFHGAFGRALGLQHGQSNIVLIAADGRVLFSHAGPLGQGDRRHVIDSLVGMARRAGATGAR
jgi:hypothetical protein